MSASGSKRKRLEDDGRADKQRYTTRRKAACQTCRLRKVKCDQARPMCGLCRLSGAQCVFLDNEEERPKFDAATKSISDRLEQVLTCVKNIEARVQIKGLSDNRVEAEGLKEPTKDYLQIPWGRATADSVLTWPVFQQRPDTLIEYFFKQAPATSPNGVYGSSTIPDAELSTDARYVAGGLATLPDDRIPSLVDKFLQNVHTKNPILDVDALVLAGRKIASKGTGWDAESCLVLLACALGSISQPFVKALAAVPNLESLAYEHASSYANLPPSSLANNSSDLKVGESYFILASKRLGLLKFTILGAQCYFFSGVYLMYTFRPLEAWNYFHQASIHFQFYLKSVGGTCNEQKIAQDVDRLQRISRLQRRLEQCLYWSCFKSEIEMRVELPLVQSTISSFEYPDLFPSPPTPTGEAEATLEAPIPSSFRNAVDATYSSSIRELRTDDGSRPLTEAMREIRQHRRTLYNEEESWYYYLTEVALRRISNRIINTFYRDSRKSWLQVKQWIPIAMEFDDQISTWSANLPASMQSLETASMAREHSTATSPFSTTVKESNGTDPGEISVAKEMSWCIENRILEMRSWLYQPFLYYEIHRDPTGSSSEASSATGLTSEQEEALDSLVRAGIECNIKILDWRSLPHRHHGVWFDLRAVVTAVLILNAVARTATLSIPPRLFEEGERLDEPFDKAGQPRITFAIVFARLRYWEDEASDIQKAVVMLKEIIGVTKNILKVRHDDD